jgi:tRNA threonylcarbamoyl adenosine modification protein YeaZ
MKAFFLDLASNNDDVAQKACIACVTEEKTVAFQVIDHRMSDDLLLPAIESLLQEAGWTYPDLTQIACIVGPGGFTSLRMAVTLANILADQLQIPVEGIHLSDLYKARVETCDSHVSMRIPFVWFHSTKKTDLFTRTFGIDDSPWTEPTLVPIDDVVVRAAHVGVWHAKPLPWCGELIPEHQQALVSQNLQPASLASISDTLPSFLASQTYGTALLQPWYGRGW